MYINDERYKLFETWLDSLLEDISSDGIAAFNFNIYEGHEDTYDIQLIGSEYFDEDDEDWACAEVYTSEEDICYISREEDIENWQQGLELVLEMVRKYLDNGKFLDILKASQAVGAGFVDGDIEIVYKK